MTVPTLPALTTETFWAIINNEISDEVVSHLVWHGLGYRYDETSQTWDASEVAPEWRDTYPAPPDFIGNRPAIVKLTRSTPKPHKQLLKEELGFKGYKIDQLTPQRTRRATMTNWLMSYAKLQRGEIN
ncbi:MAG: DUF1823 family protein [Leptolyngbyaceae bacterium]|nr:DUF1823 family protein [Leptolyngbyaceae bacterium]